MHHGQLFSFGLVRRDGRRHWQSLRITSGQQSHATTRMEMIQLTAMPLKNAIHKEYVIITPSNISATASQRRARM
jgi:hypothetical protein